MMNEIVLIDPNIIGVENLLKGLKDNVKVILMSETADLRSIFREVLGQSYSRVHFFAHGAPGKIIFPCGEVDVSFISEFEMINSRDMEIYIWSCNVAEGEVGKNFLKLFKTKFRADVYASSLPVGNPFLGGTWFLSKYNL